ncbi:aldehyde dehydrogenase family protein [Kineococcus xinjiangensis]|uniref:Aldehyde dehydrogenase family protein n=1 Tax=Kineococcus xinjiangensis TaxID=512762 RepID=A0A2S6IDM9_9ACTN|nr:aldehyde dehydrogenase family protein [Kineococcus xinjiangensis]PPK92325.1 aldehyde dehydrogenase family protein [Kineococcus xinjiangensis]
MTGSTTAPTAEADLAVLREHADEWVRTPIEDKRELLRRLRAATADAAADWVRQSCLDKGVDPATPAAGEEWMGGPWAVLETASALIATLTTVVEGRNPLDGLRVRSLPGGRLGLRVFPVTASDLALAGFTAHTWLRPGVTLEQARDGAARGVRERSGPGRVALVLGAGNVGSIPVLDVLAKLFQDGAVVLLKMSPVNENLRPVLGRVLAPFVERGFVRITTGGAEEGTRLMRHPDVAAVHVTGSRDTHDAVVFGAGAEGARRRAAREPLLAKPVTSELGGVSPVVVVPGRWSEATLVRQARHVATQRLNHSGFNCVATQVVVLPQRWPQAEEFVRLLRAALREAPWRRAYYPGAAQRQRAALDAHPGAEVLGGDSDAPRVLLRDLDPAAPDEPAFTTEYFAPTLGVTRLPGADPGEFLRAAVRFCNERLAGDLGATLLVDPATGRRLGGDLEEAVAALRYGNVGVNCWVALAYGIPRAPWGAFPGHDVHDVGSGLGTVHNALLLDPAHVERSVVRGPFHPVPTPAWFVDNRTAHVTTEHLTRFAGAPSRRVALREVAATLASAVRG